MCKQIFYILLIYVFKFSDWLTQPQSRAAIVRYLCQKYFYLNPVLFTVVVCFSWIFNHTSDKLVMQKLLKQTATYLRSIEIPQ